MTALEVARLFLFVREAGPNTGQRVEAIQRWCGGQPGESWCCYFATMVLDLVYAGASPIPREGACETVRQLALTNGWVVDVPQAGDVFLRVKDNHAHHIGFVTRIDSDGTVGTISGNTSADGASANGDRVAEHDLHPAPGSIVYVSYPRG